jgi:hypothetical protein
MKKKEKKAKAKLVRLVGSEDRRPYGVETTVQAACPFCGQIDDIAIDEGGGPHQEFVEECSVCCKPRVVHVDSSPESGPLPHVWLERAG